MDRCRLALVSVVALLAPAAIALAQPPRGNAERWRPPVPRLEIPEHVPEADLERVQECIRTHGVTEPGVSAAQLHAAAECLSRLPVPGREIRVRRVLLTQHPDAPEIPATLRALGQRYEQIGMESQALTYLRNYLERYPRSDDARALGQRAVCLARELSMADEVESLLDRLERFYGRRGFQRPDAAALARLCRTGE